MNSLKPQFPEPPLCSEQSENQILNRKTWIGSKMAVTVLTALLSAASLGSHAGDLHSAARSGDTAACKLLLASNPKALNERDWNGDTPLHVAIRGDQKDIVAIMLQHKPNL